MKILADENIPLLSAGFGDANTLLTKPGRDICPADCRNIDMLLVRSVTPVNQTLLEHSSVRFVGSTTSGLDHLDTAWLNQAGIQWAAATGCNSNAVLEYVLCTLAALQKREILVGKNLRAAVIGAGRIGSSVASILKTFGFEILICDPLRDEITTISLNDITEVDLVSLHTPLTRTGPHPTFHLIDSHFLQRQKSGCVLLNTGRGEVLCTEDLKNHGQKLILGLDVFEHEPRPDRSILDTALIATPHIAGYSVQAKWRGTQMIHQAAVKAGFLPRGPDPFPPFPRQRISFGENKTDWRDVLLRAFDPRVTSAEMKSTLRKYPEQFDLLRKKFS